MAATQQLGITETDSIGPQGLSPHLHSNTTIEEITSNALHLTGASGAALVLSDGKIMSCRACSGELAPPVGTRLQTDTGFTATCVQTAEVVRCDDTRTDPRVDGSSCVELGIRSILAVPVFNGQTVGGVLEVLSDEPNRFTDRHATALKLLARLVETLVNDAPRSDRSQANAIPDPAEANIDETRLTCLTCGHPNPQGSQFCNRCGVILLISLGQPDAPADLTPVKGLESETEEDLKEIHKLIAGSAGLSTWNEIYAKLLSNMESLSNLERTPAKREDPMTGSGNIPGSAELKPRPGTVIRRSLWL
jgi:GAF domain